MFVPSALLKKLYTFGSLENTERGVRFSIKNRLADAHFTELLGVQIDGEPVPEEKIGLYMSDGEQRAPAAISPEHPIEFPLRRSVSVIADIDPLAKGNHRIEVVFRSDPFGKLKLKVEDTIADANAEQTRIPRSESDDYDTDIIRERQRFVEQFAGKTLDHVSRYSFDPHTCRGNVEHFTGVAQVPLGIAGPIAVRGEHAQGDFLIPLATSEGTLVASYNRGIKAVNLSGGVKSTVVDDYMQRAPVFVFEDARQARAFRDWVRDHLDDIRAEAEATSSVAKLTHIDAYLSNPFVYLRFNYTTGDAAGQNMVSRATFAACGWIMDRYPDPIQHFYLESNFATDKKASQVNVLRTRGKRVTAEAVIDRDVLMQHLHAEPEQLHHHWKVGTVGSFLSGANNNGAHTPNAITALFIATGQDVANVSEASAAVLFTDLTEEGDLYVSLTIPSLIVATYGGGTGLATQRECLEMMGCYGKGKVRKFAEIVAGVCLAGELSLGAAISASDWVSSHEVYGRNR